MFINAKKVYQFKAKDSEIKDYALCLGNVSKDFTINNMEERGSKGVVKFFSLDFNPIDSNSILDIYKYLMKRTWYKIFIGFVTGLFNGSNHTKCVLLSNQKCDIQPTLINLHLNGYSWEFHYYPFSVKLDRCARSCNAINDLSNKACVPNKIEDLNLSVLSMIYGINDRKHYLSIFQANVNVNWTN